MIITTGGRTDFNGIEKAKSIAAELNIPYLSRKKTSIKTIQQQVNDDFIVVGKNRLELFVKGETEPFFFHPNSAMFRVKRILKGEHDPLIDAASLSEGMTVLDCTLGLAADSIVASFVVGKSGKVIGVEANRYLAYIVNQGLQGWDSHLPVLNEAMNRVQVIQAHSYDFLRTQETNSFDCVYFDPMFEQPVLESDGIKALSRFSLHDDLTAQLIDEAVRVAKRKVILKDYFRSGRFEKYKFQQYHRKSAKFHYGVRETV